MQLVRLSIVKLSLISMTILILLQLIPLPAWTAVLHAAPEEGGASADAVFERLSKGARVSSEETYLIPEQPTVYLTFDDGPSKSTGKVLDILKEEGVPATFFALGQEAERYPETVKRIVAEGHALGNHSYNHVYSELYGGGFERFWEQVERTDEVFRNIAGVSSTLVRAPGGTFSNFDPFYFYYLERAGLKVHDWNIDSEDARRAGMKAQDIIAAVARGPFRHEAVVLMHDGNGHEETVKALPAIIELFKEKGYVFAPLTEQVKPVALSPGKPKWPRKYSESSYQVTLAQMDEFRKERPREANFVKAANVRTAKAAVAGPNKGEPVVSLAKMQASEEVKPKESIKAAQQPAPPLRVKLGQQELLLSADDYRFKEEQFMVPLRQTVEKMGGRVSWNAGKRTATALYGFHQLQYDLAKHELRLVSPGYKVKKVPLPAMEVKEGRLYVPLRGLMEQTGNRIISYVLQADQREVAVAITRPVFPTSLPTLGYNDHLVVSP